MSDPAIINASLGPYVVRELISAGGIAEVYRVQHREDGRNHAAKIMRPERQAEKHHLKAFTDEFALLEKLDHPRIPGGRRFGEIKGRATMIIDYFPGQTLHAVSEAGKRFDIIAAFTQLSEIVAYLHGKGVIHNDLKLENAILAPDGAVALVDFGNAREIAAAPGFLARLLPKKKEAIFGTPTYVAPEILAGEGGPTIASDMYALAVCCFILLSGEPPFVHTRKSARLRATVNEAPPSIRQRVPALPLPFAKLIDGCLVKDPKWRPSEPGAFHQALKVLVKSGLLKVKLDPQADGIAGIEV